MKSFGMTDIGRKRKVNQDYLFFSDEPIGCFPRYPSDIRLAIKHPLMR